MTKLIIFDLDRTLLDTSRDIHKALNDTLKSYGVPEISLENTLKFVGNGARKLIERALGENYGHLLESVYKDYLVNFAGCGNALTSLYGYESEVLKNFAAAGVKLAIVTNKPQDATEIVCAQYLSEFGFELIVGQCDGAPLKPDPSSTLEIINKLAVEKENCLFVGDGETDIATARAAGIKCISALWGYRSRKQLEEAGGKTFASDFRQLEKMVLEF